MLDLDSANRNATIRPSVTAPPPPSPSAPVSVAGMADSGEIVRRSRHPLAALLFDRLFLPLTAIARDVWPLPTFGGTVWALRYDDTVEVLRRGDVFRVVYAPRLIKILGGASFVLGIDDVAKHDRQAMTMRVALGPVGEALTAATARAADRMLDAADDGVDVVDFVRSVSQHVLLDMLFSTTQAPPQLSLWTMRLFEYQFLPGEPDRALATEVDAIAPALRDYVDRLIDARKRSGVRPDDVLGRALALQRSSLDGPSNEEIRTILIGLLVAGLPQLPMAGPQALEQLLRRPRAFAAAQAAARASDTAAVARLLREALRFDPLAPMIERHAVEDTMLAAGTSRARRIRAGQHVAASPFSAMHDDRRIVDPTRFDAARTDADYLHFGHGLHHCFGAALVAAILPPTLAALLGRRDLRRANGRRGRLVKRGVFAHSLYVQWARSGQSTMRVVTGAR